MSGEPQPATIEIKCTHVLHSPHFVSVGCDTYDFGGGPYPNIGFLSFNVWTCGQSIRVITSRDLCALNAPCRRALERAGAAHFVDATDNKQRLWSELSNIDRKKVDLFETFVFRKEGIVFSLMHQVPHALAGSAVFLVPYTELDASLSESTVYTTLKKEIAEPGTFQDKASAFPPL